MLSLVRGASRYSESALVVLRGAISHRISFPLTSFLIHILTYFHILSHILAYRHISSYIPTYPYICSHIPMYLLTHPRLWHISIHILTYTPSYILIYPHISSHMPNFLYIITRMHVVSLPITLFLIYNNSDLKSATLLPRRPTAPLFYLRKTHF